MNRAHRDQHRGELAARQARASGADAMTAAIAQIEAAFSPAIHINQTKLAVEHVIALGCDHPEVRARYGARARAGNARTLDDAIAVVECWRLAEQRRPGRSPLSLAVMAELALILRLMRMRGLAWTFPMVMARVMGERGRLVHEAEKVAV